MRKTKFAIQGMTCSSCSAHVEKAVKNLQGIQEINVNLLSNSMVVNYDEIIITESKIIEAVRAAGYGASIEKKESDKQKEVIKNMKKRLLISICFLIPLMYVAMHQMFENWFGVKVPEFIQNTLGGNENAITFAIIQILLLIPIIIANRNYFITGFKRLWKRTPNMDSLIALGSSAAIVYGFYALYKIIYGLTNNQLELVETYRMDLYFESAGMILTLITFGKYLETKSKGKTSEAIEKLMDLAPKTAFVIRDNEEQEIAIEEIQLNEIVVIKPGGSIPVDGIVINGSSSIDQSSITGESIPVTKREGDTVISGTINQKGSFHMKATKIGKDTTLSQIIQLVEEASNSKAPISKLADKVSGIFVPSVIGIALIATLFWLVQGQSIEFAMSIGISVLVISCPCALGLATPVAIMVGTGKGAEHGILFKSAESLEALHEIDTVVLDKTGTITEGKPKVVAVKLLMPFSNQNNGQINDNESNKKTNKETSQNNNNKINKETELLKLAATLEKNSEHPLATAIIEKAKEEKIELDEVKDFISISGRGVKGKINNTLYFGGNLAFMEENKINISKAEKESEEFLNQGRTVLYFADEQEIIGIIVVADTIKETSYQAIQEMKKQNLEIVMLTGDNKKVAESIAKDLKIDKVVAEILPQQKEKEVSKLQEKNKKVVFVGDGINDSPALTRANVGIAIGSGTDIAVESADVVLMKNSLLDVVTAINLSKAVIKNIKMNLFWAFFYNSIGIPIAAGVFYFSQGLKLNPMLGAAAMSLSSVCVVTNALRLKRFKVNYEVDKNNSSATNQENNIDSSANSGKEQDVLLTQNEDRKVNVEEENMNETIKEIFIEGMHCNHCKMAVEKVLNKIDGVKKAEVNLEEKKATITIENEVDDNMIRQLIEEEGFEVKEIK